MNEKREKEWKMFCLETTKQYEHESQILSIDVYEGEYCVTVGQDNAVKVWDLTYKYSKRLLRDINLIGAESACFINP